MTKLFKLLFLTLTFLIAFVACNPESDTQLPPVITTTAPTSISYSTALAGGNITSNGGADVLTSGVCWSTTTNPTITNNKTTASTANGKYTITITGLTASTTYFVRAYATNNVGTSYGNEIQFTTLAPTLPELSTTEINSINQTVASGGGNITSDGGLPITSRGLCWSLKNTPSITDYKSTDGSGSGNFTSSITGLIYGKVYYARAYAINSKGITYGNTIKFFTSTETVTDIDGNLYHTVIIGNQTWMVENLKTTKYNDGTNIPNNTVDSSWPSSATGIYCWFQNSTENRDIYGGLYNWHAVNTGKLAPKGWHVPTNNEWKTLLDFVQSDLGYSSSIGKTLASSEFGGWTPADYWGFSSTLLIGNDQENNNYSGFSALPGSYILAGKSGFEKTSAYFWTSTSYSQTDAYLITLSYKSSSYAEYISKFYDGFSVRCIKN